MSIHSKVESKSAEVGSEMSFPRISTVITWATPFDEDLWIKTAHLAGRTATRRLPSTLTIGLALPKNKDGYIADLTGNRDRKKTVYWVLFVKPRPESEPPNEVVQTSERIGGMRGLSQFIIDNIISSKLIAANYRCRISLGGASGWKCKLVPSDFGTEHLPADLGQGGRLEEIGYRFQQGGANGLEEFSITYGHSDNTYHLQFRANGLLKIGEEMSLPFVTEMTEFIVGRLFSVDR